MSGFSEAVLALTAVSLLGGLVLSLLPGGTQRDLVRLIFGLLFAILLLRPLLREKWDLWQDFQMWQEDVGTDVSQQGSRMAQEARKSIITETLEAYILDKAKEIGADVQAHVTLDNDGLPIGVQIQGNVQKEQQEKLSAVLEQTLGIQKEAQFWSG